MRIKENRGWKGLLINVFNRLFRKSAPTCSLKELAENRFSVYQLLRSTVNIVGDMSGERLEHTDMLKQITGNDTIAAEQKFKAQFRFKPKTKLIFALNELPGTSDPSHGFFRRPLIYPFKQRFEGDKKDNDLQDKIITPEALSYWAYLAITAYGQMMTRQSKEITESNEMKAELQNYRMANDIVAMAVEDGVIEFGQDYTIPRELLHMVFEIYAESLGRKAPAANKLIERIRNAPEAGEIKDARVGPTGGQVKVWKGIRLGETGKTLRKEREFIDQETKEVVKASTLIEDFYRMGKTTGKLFFDTLPAKSTGAIRAVYVFTFPVSDEPGIIGRVASLLGQKKRQTYNIGILESREDDDGQLLLQFDSAAFHDRAIVLLT